MSTSSLPRAKLAHLPTPIEELNRFSNALGGPRIFIKRDDCTGLATGGNKTRKLEYIIGDAQKRSADTLVTEGGLQSNHCRQTVAAASRTGMDCVLVLNRGGAYEVTGNLLLDQILGARVIVVENPGDREPAMLKAADELKARGKNPYMIPAGGSNGVGAMGYANFMQEVKDQAGELGLGFDAIVTASGSGGTQGGLMLGLKLLDTQTRIIGISDGEPRDELMRLVLNVAMEGAALLGTRIKLSEDDVTIYDEYFGEGYGIPTPEMVAAVRMVARSEGILLDPVYSGKAMAGLIDLIRKGAFEKDQKVLFIHTGGTPALFAYRETFAE
jgi:L-cysteate sulfo-lyase